MRCLLFLVIGLTVGCGGVTEPPRAPALGTATAPAGQPILRTCAKCGHVVPDQAKYCLECGARLNP